MSGTIMMTAILKITSNFLMIFRFRLTSIQFFILTNSVFQIF